MDIGVVLLKLVHVIAASIWFAVGGYQFLMNRDELKIEYGTVAKYYAMLSRVSKIGMLMPLSSLLTTVAGIALYLAAGYHNRGFGSVGSIVFHIGVVAGLIGFVQGMVQLGRLSSGIAGALRDVNVEHPTESQIAGLKAQFTAMDKILVPHTALIVIAFICMSLGSSIA